MCGGKASKEEIDTIRRLEYDMNSQWSTLGQKSRALSHLLRHSKAVPRDEGMFVPVTVLPSDAGSRPHRACGSGGRQRQRPF